MQGSSRDPHFLTEPAAWNPLAKQYRLMEYGQTVGMLSSKKRALQWLRTTRAEMRHFRKMGLKN